MPSIASSLSAKLILAAGGAITLILAGAITLVSADSSARIEAMAIDRATAEARAVANTIGTGLGQATAVGNALAGAIGAAHEAGLRDRATYVAMLKPAIGTYPNLFGSWMAEAPGGIDGVSDPAGVGANKDGAFTPYWTRSANGTAEYSTFGAKYEADWYKEPVARGRGYLTAPYLSETGVLMSSAAFPVRSGGQLIGVAGIDVGMQELAATVSALKPFGTGRALLVTGDENWLVAPDAAMRTKPYEDVGAGEIAKAVADGQPRVLGLLPDGSTRVVLPFTVPGFELTWATLVDVPAAVVAGPVNEELTLLIGGGALLVLIALATLALASHRVVRRPMQQLLHDVQALSAGDYTKPIEGQRSRDEAGALAIALEGFRHELASGRQAEAVAAQERVHAETARREGEAERSRAAAEQAEVVSLIGAGLARLSAGDLTCRLSGRIGGAYAQLAADFDTAVSQLEDTIRTVAGAVASIDGGTGEITAAAQEMARRIEGQAASLEETSAALADITVRVNESAGHAASATTTVKSACQAAQASDEVVRQAIEAMRAIEHSSARIAKIIGVIDEITFQTNLLALNAGVEAARAGEAGRGFAVVAQEVRGLAQRSAEAAKEIKDLIAHASHEVEVGVTYVERAGTSLQGIAAKVLEIDTKVAAIARGAAEQSTGIREINTAVSHIDQITQQNAAMLEEAAASSQSLRVEAGELSELVAQFEIGETRGRMLPPHVGTRRAA
ncbi:methyl-accepting chemotaxis protein [Aureimonas sp. AU22]|uniref:methyl-accepting chemotaxis protein n=1 Tax=Aureimonas sp. AU22 TaxID=1638162 RepID=UPI000781FC8B|nr:methyl-accepting chemotaxis protein [Aureimonas sp. AU22]